MLAASFRETDRAPAHASAAAAAASRDECAPSDERGAAAVARSTEEALSAPRHALFSTFGQRWAIPFPLLRRCHWRGWCFGCTARQCPSPSSSSSASSTPLSIAQSFLSDSFGDGDSILMGVGTGSDTLLAMTTKDPDVVGRNSPQAGMVGEPGDVEYLLTRRRSWRQGDATPNGGGASGNGANGGADSSGLSSDGGVLVGDRGRASTEDITSLSPSFGSVYTSTDSEHDDDLSSADDLSSSSDSAQDEWSDELSPSSTTAILAAKAAAAQAAQAYMEEIATKKRDLRALQQMLHMKSGIDFLSLRMDHRGQGSSSGKFYAPIVASFKHGDVINWLVGRGYDTSPDSAEARVARWTSDRVLEQVGGMVENSSSSYSSAAAAAGVFGKASSLSSPSGQRGSIVDRSAVMYRFVDPWEVEALSFGSPLDTPGYVGRASFRPCFERAAPPQQCRRSVEVAAAAAADRRMRWRWIRRGDGDGGAGGADGEATGADARAGEGVREEPQRVVGSRRQESSAFRR